MMLLEPFHTDELNVKNRVVMAPMTRTRADNPELAANDLIAEYYGQRASAGLIITEGTHVSRMARGAIRVPGIYTPEQIAGWRKSTGAVHAKGGKIFAQIWHEGRLSLPEVLDGHLPMAPSAINPGTKVFSPTGEFKDTTTPHAMTIEEVKQTVQDFAQAAANALQAGFDGVEIHAANGYLFHQFFMKCSNTRTDAYGGNIENRCRFLFEVLEAIRAKIDIKKVGIRLSPLLNKAQGMVQDDETEQLFTYMIGKLNDYPLAYVHLSGVTGDPAEDPLKQVLDSARYYRNIYKGTLMINKGFTRDTANQAIEDGIADLVSFGDLYISNPDLVERFRANAPLNKSDRATFYATGPKGYTDYPFYK
ncbi:MAG: alkene reductase [Tannerellaceae bacterium]|nr:alkene reductase [Tannerellaceae bacterium]